MKDFTNRFRRRASPLVGLQKYKQGSVNIGHCHPRWFLLYLADQTEPRSVIMLGLIRSNYDVTPVVKPFEN